jgi:DNA-binding response OmpR family regulator
VETLLLAKQSLLVVEDEPLISMEVEDHLRAAGAKVLAAHHLAHALRLAEHFELTAAVLDYNLGRETSTPICHRLIERHIPFMFYSGERHAAFRQWPNAPVLIKPAAGLILVNAVTRLVQSTFR